jgi:heme exporter protein D
MNWGGVSEFFAMGGYAGFVWGSFGVTAACCVVEIALLLARHRSAMRQLPGTAPRAE